MVDEDSVTSYLDEHGAFTRSRTETDPSHIEDLRIELADLRTQLQALQGVRVGEEAPTAVERERDELRVSVVNLQEALARMRFAADSQRSADVERSEAIEHLLAAIRASERADTFRRKALDELEEALAGFTRPGHGGSAASSE